MVNRNKILSDLSKFAVDAMSAFSGLKEEIETIVSLRVNKVIKKMNLVKKDEHEALKKLVDKLTKDIENIKKSGKKSPIIQKNNKKKVILKKKTKKK
tara:strand:+ start:76 stop:366 length:291 start_codon:yes stop_codon:yes gene_type:complete